MRFGMNHYLKREQAPHQLSFPVDLQKPGCPEGVPPRVWDMYYDNFSPPGECADSEHIYNVFVGDWPSLESFLKDRFEMEHTWWMEMEMDAEEGDFPYHGPDDDLFFDSLLQQGLSIVEDPLGRHEGVFVFDLNNS